MGATTNQSGTGMPPQPVPSYVSGTYSPRTSALQAGANNADAQNRLINSAGGGRRKYKGGAAAVATNASSTNNTLTVPPVQSGAVNSKMTQNQFTDITILSAGAQENAKYDKAGGGRKSRRRIRRIRIKRRKSRKNRRTRRRR